MNTKTKKILRYLPLSFAAYIILMSASLKLSGSQQLVEHYTQIKIVQYMKVLGMMEIIFVALFLYPKTLKTGFLLLTGYFGGAIATELSHGNSPVFPVAILTLVWVAAWLRDPGLFVEKENKNNKNFYSKKIIDYKELPVDNEYFI